MQREAISIFLELYLTKSQLRLMRSLETILSHPPFSCRASKEQSSLTLWAACTPTTCAVQKCCLSCTGPGGRTGLASAREQGCDSAAVFIHILSGLMFIILRVSCIDRGRGTWRDASDCSLLNGICVEMPAAVWSSISMICSHANSPNSEYTSSCFPLI